MFAPRLLAAAFFSLLQRTLTADASYVRLSDASLGAIRDPGASFDLPSGPLLAPLLHPRVPGTDGSLRAQEHLAGFFRRELPGWHVGWQNSTSRTPLTDDRDVPFVNLILTRDPPGVAPGDVARLTLAAHYDTLPELEGFVGAVDAAAPCAMLLHIARAVDVALEAKWAASPGGDGLEEEKGVRILLLDGEEKWGPGTGLDSLFGSRHVSLAEKWASESYTSTSIFSTPLKSISLFVLLDLLGAPEPTVPSYFPTTHWAYLHLAEVERRMRGLGILETRPAQPFLCDGALQTHKSAGVVVVDDHTPFLERGVDVMHVIPTPFPWDIWHTMNDDGEHLDLPTVRDWARIVTGFVAEWMELDGYILEEAVGDEDVVGNLDEKFEL